MPLKTPGKLNSPPPQAAFDKLPLARWCAQRQGVYYRLHGLNGTTGKPWPPVHFSRAGTSRFDPVDGPGTLYVGETLAGVLLEVFDDSWGSVNSPTRSLTRAQLNQWWVTLVAVPSVTMFFAHGINLSKIGTDIQLLAGDHAVSRRWASRLIAHPFKVDSIYYPSRHDGAEHNLAIFNRRGWQGARLDGSLVFGKRKIKVDPKGAIVHGPSVLLRRHPELQRALTILEVAILP
jgi:hypothetical protein